MLNDKQVIEAICQLTNSNSDTGCGLKELLTEAHAIIKRENTEPQPIPDSRIIEILCRFLNALRQAGLIKMTKGGLPVDALPVDSSNFYQWQVFILPPGMRKRASD